MESIYDLTREKLRQALVAEGLPGYAAEQVFGWLYKKNAKDFRKMTSLSVKQRGVLREKFCFTGFDPVNRQRSQDSTEKYLFQLKDRAVIESAMIPENQRRTVCVSTQVGCRFRCKFCASGREGLRRNLKVSEIIQQYLAVSEMISPRKVSNVVFMGIGEPLDNFQNTVEAIKIFTDNRGIGMSPSRITVSTCGICPKIKELGRFNPAIKLSVSLHAADNGVRSDLMPVNKKYPLEELILSVKQFAKSARYPVTFEYILLEGVNADINQARKLSGLLAGVNAKVNLIPSNSSDLNPEIFPAEKALAFQNVLKTKGIVATIRKTRGGDILAACGQLKAHYA